MVVCHLSDQGRFQADSLFLHGSIYKVTRELKKEQNSLYNCINSVVHDAAFVHEIRALYPTLPLFANLRCGLWYTAQQHNGTCYFKSTDGHNGNWSFSSTRLNWNVCEAAAKHGGVLIVDATRKGKRFPDALTKTIPVWAAVVNRAVARVRNVAMQPPPLSPLASGMGAMHGHIPDGAARAISRPSASLPIPVSPSAKRLSLQHAPDASSCSQECSLTDWLQDPPPVLTATDQTSSNRTSPCGGMHATSSRLAASTFSDPHAGPGRGAIAACRQYALQSSSQPTAAQSLAYGQEPASLGSCEVDLHVPGLERWAEPKWDQLFECRAAGTDVATGTVAGPGCRSSAGDGTRRAHDMPGALPEAPPAEWDCLLHLPLWISTNERLQIEQRLDAWVDLLLSMGADVQGLAQVLRKPLRPLWISQSSLIWVDQVAQPDTLPFTPLVLVSASQPQPYQRLVASTWAEHTLLEEREPAAVQALESEAALSRAGAGLSHLPQRTQGHLQTCGQHVAGQEGCGPHVHSGSMPCCSADLQRTGEAEGGRWEQEVAAMGSCPMHGNAAVSGISGGDAVAAGEVDERQPLCAAQHSSARGDDEGVASSSCNHQLGLRLGRQQQQGSNQVGSSAHTLQQRQRCEWTYVYVPGAGDDEESWAAGLSPELFWQHHQALLRAGPDDVLGLVQHLIANQRRHHSTQGPGAGQSTAIGAGQEQQLSASVAAAVAGSARRHGEYAATTDEHHPLPAGVLPAGQQSVSCQVVGDGIWLLGRTGLALGSLQAGASPSVWQHVDAVLNCGLQQHSAMTLEPAWLPPAAAARPASKDRRGIAGGGSGQHGRPQRCDVGTVAVACCCGVCATCVGEAAGTGSSLYAACAPYGPLPRYLWLPIEHNKFHRTSLIDNLDAALHFVSHHLHRGHRVLIHDANGLDTCVCIAVAALLACFGPCSPSGPQLLQPYNSPRPAGAVNGGSCADEAVQEPAPAADAAAIDGMAASDAAPGMRVLKDSVRQRLAYVSGCYPHGRPTRGMLRQVFNLFVEEDVGSFKRG